jgi:hypothetical protein
VDLIDGLGFFIVITYDDSPYFSNADAILILVLGIFSEQAPLRPECHYSNAEGAFPLPGAASNFARHFSSCLNNTIASMALGAP